MFLLCSAFKSLPIVRSLQISAEAGNRPSGDTAAMTMLRRDGH
jgi:hypothetical protein